MTAWIGIDAGTTNVKVVLIDGDALGSGRSQPPVSARRSVPVVIDGGTATQDAEALVVAVFSALTEVVAAAPHVAARVTAIGVCSQYSSIVPVDSSANPTSAMAMWLDRRGTDACWALMGDHPDAFQIWLDRHGIPPVGGGLSLGHLLRFEADPPPGTVAYCEAMDLLTARLTGRLTATQHSMFAAQLCDNRDLSTLAYDPTLLDLAGIDAGRLPPLVAPGSVIGTLTPRVAASTGLPSTTKVVAGSNDTGALLVATGASAPGVGGLSIGTTSVLVDAVDHKHTDIEHEIISMPSVFSGEYVVCAENGLGGKAMEHALTSLLLDDDVFGTSRTDPFEQLDEALAASPPGAGGVLCLPWFNGTLAPRSDPAQRGAFLNLSLATRRVDLARATAEGVAHSLAWLLPHVEHFTGETMSMIGAAGGGMRSRAWAQIVADVAGRPVSVVPHPALAIARAAALLAAHRVDELSREDLESQAGGGSMIEPDSATVGFHADRQALFGEAFDAVAVLHQRLGHTSTPAAGGDEE